MNKRSWIAVGMLVLGSVFGSASAVNAALVQNFTVADSSVFSGVSGSIEFDQENGGAANIDAFSISGSAFENTFSYTLGDRAVGAYSISPDDWSVGFDDQPGFVLNVVSNPVDSLTPGVVMTQISFATLFDDFNFLQMNCEDVSGLQRRNGLDNNAAVAIAGFTPVHPVPLPAALPLFLSALAGLGFFGWRRRRAMAA